MSDTRNKAAEEQRRERLAITATPDPWREKAETLAAWIHCSSGNPVDGPKDDPDICPIMRELGFEGYGEGEK